MPKRILVGILCLAVLCTMGLTGCSSSSATAATASVVQTSVVSSAASSNTDAAALVQDIPSIQAFTDEAVAEDDIEAIVMAGVNAPSSMNGQPWHFSVVTDKEALESIGGGMSFGAPRSSDGTAPADGSFTLSTDAPQIPEGFSGDAPQMPEGSSGDAPQMPEGFSGDAPQMPQGGSDKPADLPEGASFPSMPSGSANLGSSSVKAGITDAPLVIIISCKQGSELDAGLAAQNMSVEAQLLGYGSKIISSPTIALNGSNKAEYQELFGIPEDMSVVCVLLVGKTDTENYDAVSGATTRNAVEDVVSYIK